MAPLLPRISALARPFQRCFIPRFETYSYIV
jgi:hypothetical protein